ncbi:hypothetical protein Y032_0163g3482 [Ancylostoma ceylanicum]|uniref:Endonuclease/exonuclease/phosphatase domain-containing protein n=1 Tax=Ancylostoma ceylanicum TaxID=53326 RepID=A0A016SXQ1_9BILA|nr:hypothetical protein Y032_0163g3482 [Ancylostoma ceylanicum]
MEKSNKRESCTIRLASINVGTLTERSRDIAETLKKRRVDTACVQEMKWKGAKLRDVGDGYKLIYYGTTVGRNGVGIIVSDSYPDFVNGVQRVSDRLMSIKITEGGDTLRVVCAYAPQCLCTDEMKECFYRDLEALTQKFEENESILIGGDFNDHVGSCGDSYERRHGGRGYGTRNEERKMLLSYAEAADLAVVNTFFKKKDEHLVTYRNGGVATQIDYMLMRRKELKNIIDAKVIPSDGIAPQHRLLVMDVRLQHRRPVRPMVSLQRIKWWKMTGCETELQGMVKAQ